MKINNAATIFSVTDIDRALAFFKDVLGFEDDFRFGDYAGVVRNGIALHLASGGLQPAGTGNLYLFCDEVDGYYTDIVSRGAEPIAPPENQPFGLRDFQVRDPDGNLLAFGCEA